VLENGFGARKFWKLGLNNNNNNNNNNLICKKTSVALADRTNYCD